MKSTLTWITRGRILSAYPYQITDGVMGWSVYIFGPQHSQMLARDLKTKKLAQEFAQRHYDKIKESA